MYNPDRIHAIHDYVRFARRAGALALSVALLAACNAKEEAVPSHQVTVQPGQTIDDISYKECGTTLLGLGTIPRRKEIIEFNDLDGNSVHQGQVLNIPDSLCQDTGGGSKS